MTAEAESEGILIDYTTWKKMYIDGEYDVLRTGDPETVTLYWAASGWTALNVSFGVNRHSR